VEQLSLISLTKNSLSNKKLSSFKKPVFSTFIHKGLVIFLTRVPYQRGIKLYIDSGKPFINCSYSMSSKEIIDFLDQNWLWLNTHIAKQNKIKKKYPLKKFNEGDIFLFKGKKITLIYKNTSLKSSPEFKIEDKKLIYYWWKLEHLSSYYLKDLLKMF